MSKIKFHNVTCAIDVSFWHVLAKKKLEEMKLNDQEIEIYGYYTTSANMDLSPVFRIIPDSFSPNISIPSNSILIKGTLKVFNTREEFRSINLQSILNLSAESISTSKLCTFTLLVYADLKDFKFTYWVGFPVYNFSPLDFTELDTSTLPLSHIKDYLASQVNSASLPGVFGLTESNLVTEDWTSSETICFIDPAPYPDFPSSILRNILALLSTSESRNKKIVSIKNAISGNSEFFKLDKTKHYSITLPDAVKGFVGWELNSKGKLGPKTVDLKAQLDPVSLANSAVNLNLKLMRWRMMPDIDLDTIAQTRCLLLGAGTLGSQVARNLMAWGVKTITFIDSSKVSYSNPVRQSLYEFEDSVQSSPKALKAAERLKKIYPGMNSAGLTLQIPMPGHNIDLTLDSALSSFNTLCSQIESHDVVFLLTDSRESRWLPTVISNAYNKICFSVALGFDSFLVVRHGAGDLNETSGKLGCYFCNDVVGPRNSMTDRTLDQQCTVTRPGLSYQASAVAVELLVSLLQHPLKNKAPHGDSTVLGTLPHQIRGNFSSFSISHYSSLAFSKCTGCSNRVVDRLRQEGFEFVKQACNDPDYLEELCDLKELSNINEDDLIEIDDWED